jgi:hypothetical protein
MTKPGRQQLALIACTAVFLGAVLLAARAWRRAREVLEAADDAAPGG